MSFRKAEGAIAGRIQELTIASLLVPGIAKLTEACPDPDDEMLFSAMVESTGDFLVTGDKRLQAFNWRGPGLIRSPRQFWHELPEQLLARLTPPLYAWDSLTRPGDFHVIDTEQGKQALALFASEVAAEQYRQATHLLAHELMMHSHDDSVAFLQYVLDSGCPYAALNPHPGQYAIVWEIPKVQEHLRSASRRIAT